MTLRIRSIYYEIRVLLKITTIEKKSENFHFHLTPLT